MERENWRQGRRVGHHIYRQMGAEPSDRDPWIGSFVDPYDAEIAVATTRVADRLLAIDRDLTEVVKWWASQRGGARDAVHDPRLAELLDRLAGRFAEIEEADQPWPVTLPPEPPRDRPLEARDADGQRVAVWTWWDGLGWDNGVDQYCCDWWSLAAECGRQGWTLRSLPAARTDPTTKD